MLGELIFVVCDQDVEVEIEIQSCPYCGGIEVEVEKPPPWSCMDLYRCALCSREFIEDSAVETVVELQRCGERLHAGDIPPGDFDGVGADYAALFSSHSAAIKAAESAGWILGSESIGGDSCPQCAGRRKPPRRCDVCQEVIPEGHATINRFDADGDFVACLSHEVELREELNRRIGGDGSERAWTFEDEEGNVRIVRAVFTEIG